MFHKIISVIPEKDFKVITRFIDGTITEYDMAPLFDTIPAFKIFIDNPEVFEGVCVDVGGYGIVWNDNLDLSSEEIWEKGKTIESQFSGLLSFAEASEIWHLRESTLRKAVSYGKFAEGIDICKFGKQWVISFSAMIREYGEPRKLA